MPGIDFAPYMEEAIALARRARFRTWPNPAVGAVLVNAQGSIVASGWHHAAGHPHAEIECLKDAAAKGVDPRGLTMVVTLEPCVHFGKTPPCSDALIEAGIGRLVYGTTDPNSEAGGGASRLAEAGVEVVGPVLQQQCKDLIADFTVWQTTDRPYILLKLACTLDGRIATRTGHSRWISSDSSRGQVHGLRADIAQSGGAVLIGGGTFRADNPQLTSRLEGQPNAKQPLACVLTSRLPKPDADLRLLRERPDQTVFFASPAATASTTAEALRKLGCRILALGPGANGSPDFALMFSEIRNDLGCPYVLCEGGGKLALSLLESGYIDEFHLHMAPLVLGDNDARPLFEGRSPLSLDEALKMRFCQARICDADVHLVLRPLDFADSRAS